MKIALITIHVGNNFGSILQSIASVHVLKKLGHNVVIVDYRPDRVTFRYYVKGALASPVKLIWRILFLPIYLKNRFIYKSFLTRFCEMSTPIYSNDDFKKKCPQADVYMTGSDQVWNSKHNQGFDERYFFSGIKGKKISYSSSIGQIDLQKKELEMFKKALKDYSYISVRENTAVDIIEKMDLKATQLVDPTFMLTEEEWRQYMSPRIEKFPYILLYLPYNIKDKDIILKSARKIASLKKLKIVTFSWTIISDISADRTIKFANPGDFLSLVYFADCIITNSFHGTAFSINLNKEFWVYQPTAFSTRITNILDLTSLSSRLLTDVVDLHDIKPIDYIRVNQILNDERTKSNAFLKKALENTDGICVNK